jgi:D-alanyl-lipoteichoic acid acyltransferase DltB (MBOAT superfamily)
MSFAMTVIQKRSTALHFAVFILLGMVMTVIILDRANKALDEIKRMNENHAKLLKVYANGEL